MKKLIILIDMDDTIEDLSDAWSRWLSAKYGLSVSKFDLRDWDVTKAFPTLSAKEVYAPLYTDEFWETVHPLDGADEVLRKLIDDGHEVYIVTASTYQTLKTKMEYVLFRYFPYLTWNNVIVTYNKQMIKGDILIDDGPHNLIGGSYIPILMDAPHNHSFDNNKHNIQRVYNLSEAYGIITEYAGGYK